ncbi:hypothetical protein CLIB1423_23S01662 [[Candida] railenensis]|uniref:Amino acid transporter transmembrane domain-containing protein n=1 Tax=[Candida] railenensis TaxID=45579 RepID=A0A9P0QUL9_9ASCO|nr:hypothetical protein CLIB1423_23S01662 [[Candida] railenensis]
MSNLKAITSIGSVVLSENGNVFEKWANEKDSGEDFHHVPLEEFLFEARVQRELEKSEDWGEAAATVPLMELIKVNFFGFTPRNTTPKLSPKEKSSDVVSEQELCSESATDSPPSEVEVANRMARTASWGSVFYLITTDILGPQNAPYAIAQLGYVPGSLLYFLFGIVAAYTGYLLWVQFIALDSHKYPLRSFGDVVGRIYGREARYVVDVFQVVQLIFNVAIIILGNGQGLSQMAKGRSCYTILIFVWAIAGAIVGQIKSLQKFGFLANLAIWINVFIIIVTIVCAAKEPPNYILAQHSGIAIGPVVTKVIKSGAGEVAFTGQLGACMNIIYAYGGAMVFIEFMSEMKRPWDFIKGMACAQTFIFVVYLVFGLLVYHYQGQFVSNPANQGISSYVWQTITNSFSLVSSLIAGGLYGNVGMKVFYVAFIQKLFHTPDLDSKVGRFIWIGLVIIYWAIAFIIAAAIPQFSSLTSLISAICILQFTYTFPPIMQFGLDIQVGALDGDGPYDPIKKITNRVDSWRNLSRWTRGYKKHWFRNTCNLILFLASLATAGLGLYSSGESLAAAYRSGAVTSFTCHSTVA